MPASPAPISTGSPPGRASRPTVRAFLRWVAPPCRMRCGSRSTGTPARARRPANTVRCSTRSARSPRGCAATSLVFRTMYEATARKTAYANSLLKPGERQRGPFAWYAPYYTYSAALQQALFFNLYVHNSAIRPEQVAQIAINQWRNAALNPKADRARWRTSGQHRRRCALGGAAPCLWCGARGLHAIVGPRGRAPGQGRSADLRHVDGGRPAGGCDAAGARMSAVCRTTP